MTGIGERDSDEQGVSAALHGQSKGGGPDDHVGRVDRAAIASGDLHDSVFASKILGPGHVHANVGFNGDLVIVTAGGALSTEKARLARVVEISVSVPWDALIDKGIVKVLRARSSRHLDLVQVGLTDVSRLHRGFGVDLSGCMPPCLQIGRISS